MHSKSNISHLHIICDHYPLSPRVNKLINSIQKQYLDMEITVLTWNRTNKNVTESFIFAYSDQTGYGKTLSKLYGMIGFVKFIRSKLQHSESAVHVVDFSMLTLLLFMQKPKITIYEIYDIKFLKRKIFDCLREIIEKFIINRKIDAIIVASPYFKAYYRHKLKFKREIKVINNKPEKKYFKTFTSNYVENTKKMWNISFIGTVRHEKILKNLMLAVQNISNTNLTIYGDGPALIELQKYTKRNIELKSVNFSGRYNVNELSEIYEKTDIVWAAYPSENLNVKRAISNKFFEAMIARRPIIVSEKTKISNLVKKYNIGTSVDPYDVADIQKKLSIIIDNYQNYCYGGDTSTLFWEAEEHRIIEIVGNSSAGN